ncbi:MAG: hypothetical protein KKA73_11215 [Chloroflexi bacterium]|nr:hypothetical protein [Chloroflexota bacterium]MBU1748247.1 hypothetical protein [Chloroflexota bacterium]
MKLTRDEQVAFSQRYTRRWRAGQLRRIKQRFNRRERRLARQSLRLMA